VLLFMQTRRAVLLSAVGKAVLRQGRMEMSQLGMRALMPADALRNVGLCWTELSVTRCGDDGLVFLR
jgi:hypothetical protein